MTAVLDLKKTRRVLSILYTQISQIRHGRQRYFL
jgi:hypothetical protein